MKVKVTHIDNQSHIWLQLEKDVILDRINLNCGQCLCKMSPLVQVDPNFSLWELRMNRRYLVLLEDGTFRRAALRREEGEDNHDKLRDTKGYKENQVGNFENSTCSAN